MKIPQQWQAAEHLNQLLASCIKSNNKKFNYETRYAAQLMANKFIKDGEKKTLYPYI